MPMPEKANSVMLVRPMATNPAARRRATAGASAAAGAAFRSTMVPAAVEKHIRELEALGVKRPASTPIFYRVSAARITSSDTIEAVGENSGGEVEFVLLEHAGRLWVGTGSDHTDREVEKYGVTVSKQMCDKPIASAFWPFEEVAPHWDRLVLRSYLIEGGRRMLYQEGSVSSMIDPRALITRHAEDS